MKKTTWEKRRDSAAARIDKYERLVDLAVATKAWADVERFALLGWKAEQEYDLTRFAKLLCSTGLLRNELRSLRRLHESTCVKEVPYIVHVLHGQRRETAQSSAARADARPPCLCCSLLLSPHR